MSFDPMAAAVDWLDAYRDADIDALLSMYADDAVIHCGCGGLKTIAGTNAIRAYLADRFKSHPALALEDIRPSPDGAIISYLTTKGLVSANLVFDRNDLISALTCGPVTKRIPALM